VRHLLLALLSMAALLHAQENRSTISGSVADSTGAPIAKAKVTATETRTGVKTSVITESSGAYTIPYCPSANMRSPPRHPASRNSCRAASR